MMPGMNALLEKYENTGIVVGLGFPCNQFALQQPGRTSEILNGYTYVRPGGGWTPNPNFHIYDIVDVNGESSHPVYNFLKGACSAYTEDIGEKDRFYWNDIVARDITWNYEKFLVDIAGKPRYRFAPIVSFEEIYPYVDALLAEMQIQATSLSGLGPGFN